MNEDWRSGGFGLYLHWPFCAAKCPYCDFNSHVAQHIDQAAWTQTYLQEIDRVGALTEGRVLNSVFFGGGTPSLMETETVQAILDRVRATWPLANDVEITLEANPTSVEAEKFEGFARAGVNRVSLGVQALNNADLKRLGRMHSVAEARKAVSIAQNVFNRVSFDLIYARQDQSLPDWESELTQALDMGTDHLSLYQLTIEQGTAFGDRYNAGRLKGLPAEGLAADMYERTQEICALAGMPSYEVSNHAKPGAESRHNLIYWRYGDYAGIGPGAHGRLTINGRKFATDTALTPGQWLKDVQCAEGATTYSTLSPLDMGGEYLMMGLRVSDGIDVARFQALSGSTLDPDTLEALSELNLIDVDASTLRVTEKGRLLLNAVITQLLPE